MTERIVPFGDRLVVVPEAMTEQKTKGGLVIPELARERPVRGTVEALGPDVRAPIGIGDTVVYGQYSGTEVTTGERKILILREEDLFGRVDAPA